MIEITLLLNLATWSLILAGIAQRLAQPYSASKHKRQLNPWILMTIAAIGLLIPIGEQPLISYPRSLFGDWSLTMTVLVWAWVFKRAPSIGNAQSSRLMTTSFVVAITVMGFALYPAALGLSWIDPYQWGFHSRGLIVAVGFITLLAWIGRQWLLMAALTLATIGFNLKLLESVNYWDYLIDPILWLICVGIALSRSLGWLRANALNTQEMTQHTTRQQTAETQLAK